MNFQHLKLQSEQIKQGGILAGLELEFFKYFVWAFILKAGCAQFRIYILLCYLITFWLTFSVYADETCKRSI